MAHPYKHVGKSHPFSTDRVHKLFGHEHQKKGETATYATGGGVTPKTSKHHGPQYEGKHSKITKEAKMACGGKSMKRMDKYARGGKVKKGGKGHHTKINIVVAPSGGPGGPPPAGPMAGSPPPLMPPKAPMAPPPSPMAGGMPGLGGPPMGKPPMGGPGGMKRGGAVKKDGKYISGIANPENLAKWSKRTSENTRYARGGPVSILNAKTGGQNSGSGTLAQYKYYKKHRGDR